MRKKAPDAPLSSLIGSELTKEVWKTSKNALHVLFRLPRATWCA